MSPQSPRALMSRRHALKITTLAAGALPFAGLLSAPAYAKVPQQAVGYQPEPKDGHSCANCSLFQEPSTCKTVDGEVSANGWCKVWVKKPA